MGKMTDQLMDTPDCARYLGISPRTLEDWRWKGDESGPLKGPKSKTYSRKCVRYSLTEVLAWLATRPSIIRRSRGSAATTRQGLPPASAAPSVSFTTDSELKRRKDAVLQRDSRQSRGGDVATPFPGREGRNVGRGKKEKGEAQKTPATRPPAQKLRRGEDPEKSPEKSRRQRPSVTTWTDAAGKVHRKVIQPRPELDKKKKKRRR